MDSQKSFSALMGRLRIRHFVLASLLAIPLGLWLPAVSFAFLLILLSYLICWHFKYSVIESLALGLMIIFCGVIIVYSIFSVAGLNLAPQHVFSLLSLVCLPFLFMTRRAHPGRVVHSGDIPALMAALITFTVLLIPVFHASGSRVARFLSYGEDNASHYSLTRYITHQHKLAYLQNPDQAGLLRSLEIYPQGFHVNAATSLALIHPVQVNEAGFVKLYSFYITAVFGIMVFWIIKLGFMFNKSKLVSAILLPGATMLVGFGWLLLLLFRGFQPQVFSYAYLAAILFVLSRTFAKPPGNARKIVILVALLAIGIASSWWLLLPIIGGLVLAYIYWQKAFAEVFCSRKTLAILAFIAAIVLYPIIINMLLSQKSNPLTEQGGVDKLAWSNLLWLCPLPLAGWFFDKQKRSGWPLWLCGLILSVGLALGIGFYHLATVGHYEYYFYKSIYTVLLVLMIAFISAAGVVVERFWTKPFYRFLAAAIVISVTVTASVHTGLVYARVYVHDWAPTAVELTDLDLLFEPTSNKYQDILFAGDCSPGSDYLSNRWAGARFLSANHIRSELEQATYWAEYDKINHYIKKYSAQKSILLALDRRCAPKLDSLEQRLQQNPNLQIILTH